MSFNQDDKGCLTEETTVVSNPRNNRSKIYLWIFILFTLLILAIGMIVGFFINGRCGTTLNIQFESLSRILQKNVHKAFIKKQLDIYSGEIHQAGSDQNLILAETMASNWKDWGIQSIQLFKYRVNTTSVNGSNPSTLRLLHNGSVIAVFPTVELNGLLPRYHSYSIGGRAKGSFVFINYGLVKDLEYLVKENITFCGTDIIPIVRLGYSERAAKVKHLVSFCGAKLPGGLLVYPDPWDYAVDVNNKSSTPNNTQVYPHTWWLPNDAAVFGNMKMKSGLQSPGLPSLDGIFNTVDISEMLTPFPVQPISYGDASKIFSFMGGSPVPPSWGNCLPKYLESITKYEIEMLITNKITEKTMTNVIGHIPGSSEKDRYVVIGNHRDAWSDGASDPGSGTVILQQVVSVLANAYKKGIFQPTRSIIFANWDGEEEGLLGSTEFTSQFSSELSQRCIAYINMDCPIKGSWSFTGRSTPLLIGPMLDSAKNVFIKPSYTLFDDWRDKNPELPSKTEPKVDFLGGGSDHITFAYVLGVPSAYPEYKYNQSLPSMPTYHTKYDNIDLLTRIVDPGLDHHALVSRFVIDYAIRLSCSPIVPYSLDRLASLLLTRYPGLNQTIVASVNNTGYTGVLYNQLVRFNASVASFVNRLARSGGYLQDDAVKWRAVNDILVQLPRMFITRDGLPSRAHLRNILLSTRLSNSYLGSVYTGVFDAIDLYKRGKVNLAVVVRQMSLLSDSLRRATEILSGGGLVAAW